MTLVVPTISNGAPTFSKIPGDISKWHGIENIVGDIWIIVDGNLINSCSIVEMVIGIVKFMLLMIHYFIMIEAIVI